MDQVCRGTAAGLLVGLYAVALAALVPAAAPRAESLTVFAAASTADAMTEAVDGFEKRSGITVRLSFASSSTLARQIENGAPAQVFVSASPEWIDYLESQGYLEAGSRIHLFSNRLVLIVPRDSSLAIAIAPSFPLAEALGSAWLAMGDPDHVPAGVYGRQALEALGVWSEVAPRVARTADVRAALALVARGEAAAGITYATDALISAKVRVVGAFPPGSHPMVSYEAAIVAGAAGPAAARFLAYLRSGAAEIFARHGFLVNGG